MSKSIGIRTSALAALTVAATASLAAAGTGELFMLGNGLIPWDASGDGTVVVGENQITGQYFEWTADLGLMDIGGVIAGNGIGGRPAISDDGMLVAGTEFNPVSALHEMSLYDRAAMQWMPLGGIGDFCSAELSSGWNISGDGNNVVGLGWLSCADAHAAQWISGMGMMDLGSTVPDQSSRANGVDYDGNVVVGWQDSETGFRQGAVWIDGVQTVLSTAMGGVTEANAVSGDGQWVIGNGNFATEDEAWRWSEATGVEMLGSLDLPAFLPRGFATAMSDDGSVIIGFDRGFGPPTGGEGWIWTEDTGIMFLDDYFASFGVVGPNNLHFSLPLGMSADGLTFVGAGRSDTAFFTSWVVRLPAPEPVAYLDIKPGSCPNPLNPKSRGVVPMALLGTADFDVSMVDLSSLSIAGVAPLMGPPGPHPTYEDVAAPFEGEGCECDETMPDGLTDLVLHFRTQDLVTALDLRGASGEVTLCLTGNLVDGTPFEACDCVIIVGNVESMLRAMPGDGSAPQPGRTSP